jgi:hypothetical protein
MELARVLSRARVKSGMAAQIPAPPRIALRSMRATWRSAGIDHI